MEDNYRVNMRSDEFAASVHHVRIDLPQAFLPHCIDECLGALEAVHAPEVTLMIRGRPLDELTILCLVSGLRLLGVAWKEANIQSTS